jgi:hypothetical protein
MFPKMKLRLKGRRLDTIEEILAESQEVLNTLTLENFQGCMESWKKTLGSLYTCPRGLLRRRRRKLGVRVINFFLMVKFPELLGSTSYFNETTRHDIP